MKRYGNIYPKIYDIENLRSAHKNAKKDKKFYREVVMVDSNEDYYLNLIHHMLKNKTYKVSEYKISVINDNGKERKLCKLPYFPDRIIQWAILLQIEPVFMKTFTSFSCASIKGRGIHRASKLLDKYLKDADNTSYCLKLDVKKFYDNVNHKVLKNLLTKKFKDKELLQILFSLVDSFPYSKGIPIGSYLSQFLANFYLSYFDHWLKEYHHVKYVIRYMDDIIVLHKSKEYLHLLRRSISCYLQVFLKVCLKSNWQVFPSLVRGIDFVGYRHFSSFKLLRKSTCFKLKRKMREIIKVFKACGKVSYPNQCSFNSYKGWASFCDSFRLACKYFKPIERCLSI